MFYVIPNAIIEISFTKVTKVRSSANKAQGLYLFQGRSII